jgi:hypothetical protein
MHIVVVREHTAGMHSHEKLQELLYRTCYNDSLLAVLVVLVLPSNNNEVIY